MLTKMLKLSSSVVVLAMAISSVSLPVNAQVNPAGAAEQVEPLPLLTADKVGNWLKGMAKAKALGATEAATGAGKANPEQTVQQALADLKESGKLNVLTKDLKGLGFSSIDNWVRHGVKIGEAFVAVAIENKDIDAQVQAKIDKIKNNPAMSEQQKAFMINLVQGGSAIAKNLKKAPEENKKAVKAHFNELDNLFNKNAAKSAAN